MKLKLSGYSTALFATWYFLEEFGILFDAGDGVTASLLQKSRKVRHVFVSHADRDHLTGLLQLNQLNAREGLPVIYFPKDCGSFPAMEAFAKRFDPHVHGTVWRPITEGMEFPIRDDLIVQAIRNGHVRAPEGVSKSLSYKLIQVRHKLKPEFKDLPGHEIGRRIKEEGQAAMTDEIRTTLFGYSGDTPVEDPARWHGTEILVHEATFLGGPEDAKIETHGNRHSKLEEVMEMVAKIDVDCLVLGHFSTRYDADMIRSRVRLLCSQHQLTIPVHVIAPGETVRDILTQVPVNA